MKKCKSESGKRSPVKSKRKPPWIKHRTGLLDNLTGSTASHTNTELIVDIREICLSEQLLRQKIPHVTAKLDVGDVIIRIDGGDVECDTDSDDVVDTGAVVVVEIKRIDDLAASIGDGRWREQKSRLLSLRERTGVVIAYLIEGDQNRLTDIAGSVGRIPVSTLNSALANTTVRDRIDVITTCNLQHTVQKIQQLLCAVRKHGRGSGAAPTLSEARDYLPTKKRGGLTRRDIFANMLNQVDGIGRKKSMPNAVHYGSFASMMRSYDECATGKRPTMVTEVTGIGKKLSGNLFVVLYNCDDSDRQ